MCSPRARWSLLTILLGSSVLSAQATRIVIDIAPGDSPTVIEAGRGGVLPVAIMSTAAFDATTVDPATVLFGQMGTEVEPVRAVAEDVDRDGRTDLMIHVRVADLQLKCSDTVLRLTAQTRTGTALEGSEPVTIIGCGAG